MALSDYMDEVEYRSKMNDAYEKSDKHYKINEYYVKLGKIIKENAKKRIKKEELTVEKEGEKRNGKDEREIPDGT